MSYNKNKNDTLEVSQYDKNKMAQISLKWHTINDSGTYCNEANPFECLAVKRCEYLLHIFCLFFCL